MRQSFVFVSLSILSLILSTAQAADSEKILDPCTITSSLNKFYDLNTITVPPLKDGKKSHKDDRDESWHAKGWDYGRNFTLNFCAPVIENLEHAVDVVDVVDVDKELWRNVSAYYKEGDLIYSIGQESSRPIFRGRKLVLNYTGGSFCDEEPHRPLDGRALKDDEEGRGGEKGDDHHKKKPSSSKPNPTRRRKSSLISFICDHDSLAPKVHINFVGTSPDECTYFFETKSMAACGDAISAPQTLGPAGVFGVIFLIAAAVYLLGGIAYQRTVMHQRGWKQLPNYAIWAGIGGFVSVKSPPPQFADLHILSAS